MSSNHIKKDDMVETTHSCSNCQHKETNSLDLSVKEELADPNFEMKRKKYCLSEKEGKEYFSVTINVERTVAFMKKLKDEDENKEIYDTVKKMKKLTISELQNFLSPILDKAGYAKIEFEKPEIKKDVMVEFSLQDAKSGRGEYDSIHELQRLLKRILETTNWRLTSNGVSYRLGFLQGRLRGVEGEENLRALFLNGSKKQ